MKLLKIALGASLVVGTGLAATLAFSQGSKEATIKKALEPRLGHLRPPPP